MQPWAEFAFKFGDETYKVYRTEGEKRMLLIGRGDLTIEDLIPDRTKKMVFDMECRIEIKGIVSVFLFENVCETELAGS